MLLNKYKMSFKSMASDSTTYVNADSNLDFAQLGSAYKLPLSSMVYSPNMSAPTSSLLALKFPEGMSCYVKDITDPRRAADCSYNAPIDMMSPVNVTGDVPLSIAYPSMNSAYKM